MSERVLPKREQRFRATVVGFFVVGCLVLLILSVFWMKQFSLKPSYSFVARFYEPPYITSGSPVYFRGVKVGRVGSVKLTPDASSALVKLDINEKGLKLPSNVRVNIHTEGITGIVYVMLNLPTNEPLASTYIKDGMVVQGQEPFSLEKIQRVLNKLADEGKIDQFVEDTQAAMAESRKLVSDFRGTAKNASQFFNHANGTVENSQELLADIRRLSGQVGGSLSDTTPLVKGTINHFRTASVKLNTVLGDLDDLIKGTNSNTPKGSGGLQSATQSVKNAMEEWGETSKEMKQTFSFVRGELQQTGVIRNVGEGVQKLGLVSDKANQTFTSLGKGTTSERGGAGLIPKISLIADRFNCLQSGVSQMLNQRFLLFKFAFGRPGASLEHCVEDQIPQLTMPTMIPVSVQETKK